jgi:hypothetical protein
MIDILQAQQKTFDSIADDFQEGQLYEVLQGDEAKVDGLWLRIGEKVRVIGVYPYIVLVERVTGYPIRQCYIRRTWRKYLRRVK